jgi:hypothetical protein
MSNNVEGIKRLTISYKGYDVVVVETKNHTYSWYALYIGEENDDGVFLFAYGNSFEELKEKYVTEVDNWLNFIKENS